jgi:putative tryptophan/tyrosine transport system substrate-binding protein
MRRGLEASSFRS